MSANELGVIATFVGASIALAVLLVGLLLAAGKDEPKP